jgi:hypothetical protein
MYLWSGHCAFGAALSASGVSDVTRVPCLLVSKYSEKKLILTKNKIYLPGIGIQLNAHAN